MSSFQLTDYNNNLVVIDNEGFTHVMHTRDLPPDPFYGVIMGALLSAVGAPVTTPVQQTSSVADQLPNDPN